MEVLKIDLTPFLWKRANITISPTEDLQNVEFQYQTFAH